MAYKRNVDRLPIIPKDATKHNVTCHSCIVGCGHHTYTWPVNKEEGQYRPCGQPFKGGADQLNRHALLLDETTDERPDKALKADYGLLDTMSVLAYWPRPPSHPIQILVKVGEPVANLGAGTQRG